MEVENDSTKRKRGDQREGKGGGCVDELLGGRLR